MDTVSLVVEVRRSPAGRLTGTVALDGCRHTVEFSGTLELLACIEGAFGNTNQIDQRKELS